MSDNLYQCLGKELVERYVAGICNEQEQQAVKRHILKCHDCAKSVESFRIDKANSKSDYSSPINAEVGDNKVDYEKEKEDTFQPTFSTSGAMAGFNATKFNGPSNIEFEGYQILEELAAGGQAVVYKAIHKATKMKVALKVLLPGLLGSAKARRYFEQEVELAARLRHPNIVSIRDSGITQGQYYFCMEYIPGKPLHHYLRSEQLNFNQKVTLFDKICGAISHAHQRGVIHRDIKPSNILVDESGEPHILDFGLAKTAVGSIATSENAEMLTVTGQIKGTTAYMSPEQAAGRSDIVDVRSDVYALGVVLYEMLVGRFPYDVSGTPLEVLDNIQQVDPIRPRSIIGRFNSDMEAILLKALDKDPSQRYQSASELRHDIKCWLDGYPIIAKSVSSLYLLRKVVARHKNTSAIAGLLLLIILSFSFVSTYLLTGTRKAQRESREITAQWSNVSQNMFTSYRQIGFLQFLQAWRTQRIKDAKLVAGFLGAGSKEKVGAAFLLDPKPLGQKEAGFRREVPNEDSWFADFVVGEQHIRNGYNQEGLKAYVSSYEKIQQLRQTNQSVFDGLLMEHIKARLYDLTTTSDNSKDVAFPADANGNR